MNDGQADTHPPTRSFRPRRRRLGPQRLASYQRLFTRHSLPVEGPPLTLDDVAGAVLDIGFGYGAALVELADRDRSTPVIGVEVHTPGVAFVLDAIDTGHLDHVRVVEGDVLEFLPRLPPGSLSGIRVWFPDPWPKARQQRRRLIRSDVLALLVERVRPGGSLHLATDDAGYAAQMAEVCAAHPGLRGGPVERPSWRPVTGYERRALDAGRAVTDLLYTKR